MPLWSRQFTTCPNFCRLQCPGSRLGSGQCERALDRLRWSPLRCSMLQHCAVHGCALRMDSDSRSGLQAVIVLGKRVFRLLHVMCRPRCEDMQKVALF